MNRGDMVLYRSSGKWYERAIVLATGGIYVHVAIATSDKQVIAAGSRGINYFPFSYDPKIHTIVSLVPEHATQLGIEAGLKWAIAQAGKRYSWIDIFYQAVKFLNPNNTLRFYREGEYDCSDFCTRYLLQTGTQLPPDYEPYAVTPNDLARVYGLLPPRKG
jgi:uncharacterized protein YycO